MRGFSRALTKELPLQLQAPEVSGTPAAAQGTVSLGPEVQLAGEP